MPRLKIVVDKQPALQALRELRAESEALVRAFQSIANSTGRLATSLRQIAETGGTAATALGAVSRGIGPGAEKLSQFQRSASSASRSTNNLARAFERLQAAQRRLADTPTPDSLQAGGAGGRTTAGGGGSGGRRRRIDRGLAVREVATVATIVQGPLSGVGARAIAAASAVNTLGVAVGSLLVGFAGLLVATGKGVSALAQLEREMANVAKNAGLTRRETVELSNTVRDLAVQSGVAATEIAKIADAGARLGIRGTANLAEFADTVIRLTQSTDLQGSQAALQLVRILSLVNERIDNARTAASVLVELGSQAATTESQILTFATNIARVMSGFRVRSEDILAVAAAFAETGSAAEISRSTMQSALRSFDIELSKSATRLTEIMGATRESLRQAFDTDPIGFFVRFLVAARKEMDRTGESAARLVRSIGIREKRTSQALGGAIATAPTFVERLRAARSEAALPSAIVRQSERVRETLAERARRAGEAVDKVTEVLGAKLAPALEGFADFVTRLFGEANREARALNARELVDILRRPLGEERRVERTIKAGGKVVDLDRFFSFIEQARSGARLGRPSGIFDRDSGLIVARELGARIGEELRRLEGVRGTGPASEAIQRISDELKRAVEAGDTKRTTELVAALKEFEAESQETIRQLAADALRDVLALNQRSVAGFITRRPSLGEATSKVVDGIVRRALSDIVPAAAEARRLREQIERRALAGREIEPPPNRPDLNRLAAQRLGLSPERQQRIIDLLDLPDKLTTLLSIVRGAVGVATAEFGTGSTASALSGVGRALEQFSEPEKRSLATLFDTIKSGVEGLKGAASPVEVLARFGPRAGNAIAAISTTSQQLAQIGTLLREESLSEEQRTRLTAFADKLVSALIDTLNAELKRADFDRRLLDARVGFFTARSAVDIGGTRRASRELAALDVERQVAELVATIRSTVNDAARRDELIARVSEAGRKFKEDIISGANAFNQAVLAAADDLADSFASLVTGGRADFSRAFRDILGAGLREAFRPLADATAETFKTILQPVTKTANGTIKKALDELIDALPKAVRTAIAVATLVTAGLTKAFTPFKASGRIIVEGTSAFVDGIKGSARALDDLRRAAEGLITAFETLDTAFAAGGDVFVSLLAGLDVTVKPKKKKPIRIKGLGKFESEDAAAVAILEQAIRAGQFANQPALQTALSNFNLKGASVQDIQNVVKFVGDFLRGFDQLEPPVTDLINELRELGKRFDEAAAKAKELGLDVRAVDLARKIAVSVKKLDFAKEIQVGLLEFLDPVQAELARLEDIQRERIENAKALGLDLAAVERLNALERARAIEEAERRTKGALVDLLNELRASAQSPLPNFITFANAKERFSELQQRFFSGDTSVADDLAEAARDLLDVARERFASGPEFFEIFKNVENVLQQAVDFSVPEEQLRELQMLNDQIDSMRSTISEMRDMLRQIVEAANSRDVSAPATPAPGAGGNFGGGFAGGLGPGVGLGTSRVVAA